MDKHSSFMKTLENYVGEKFYNIDLRLQDPLDDVSKNREREGLR